MIKQTKTQADMKEMLIKCTFQSIEKGYKILYISAKRKSKCQDINSIALLSIQYTKIIPDGWLLTGIIF